MKISALFSITILLYCLVIVYCAEKDTNAPVTSSTNSNSAPSGSRQAASTALTASGILSTLTSFLPKAFSSMTGFFPALLLFGLGAMLVPALGLGMLLREGRRSDYNVQPSNLAFTNNPLFAKNLPPIIYNEKFEGLGSRVIPSYFKAQPQFQTRSMQSNNFNNLVVDILGKIQKSLDNMNTKTNKKSLADSRIPETQ